MTQTQKRTGEKSVTEGEWLGITVFAGFSLLFASSIGGEYIIGYIVVCLSMAVILISLKRGMTE